MPVGGHLGVQTCRSKLMVDLDEPGTDWSVSIDNTLLGHVLFPV